MQNRLTSMLVLSLALVTSGCSHDMNNSDIKQNPHPAKRYELTVAAQGAPGPFESATGFMQYDIANPDCAPKDPVSGARPTPEYTPDIAFIRVSDTEFKGTIYLDLPVDENYFGLGVCHWKFIAAGVSIKANGVRFSPVISIEDIVANNPVSTFFSKDSYNEKSSKGRDDLGLPNKAEQPAIDHPELFFKVIISAKEQ